MNKKESKKVFGQNLKRLRLERGMSQDELAKALGYTNRSSINKIEVGRSSVPTEKITLLAQILNVSPLELFRDDSEPVITISDKPPFKVDFSVQRFLMRSMAAYQEAEEPVGDLYDPEEEDAYQLIENYEQLDDGQKQMVQAYVQALLDSRKEKKDGNT